MKFTEIKNKLEKGNWDAVGLEIKTYIPIKVKFGIMPQIASNVIKNENGYAVVDRMENELSLCYLLCSLYTNIEFENNDFSDEDYDFFAENKFKEWLRKVTKQDSFDFENMYKNEVLDSVRKINAKGQQFDMDGMNVLLKEAQKIDPKIIELAEKMNTKQEITKEAEIQLKNKMIEDKKSKVVDIKK